MQDDIPAIAVPPVPPPSRSGRGVLAAILLAFVIGAALAAWLAWDGQLDSLFGRRSGAALRDVPAAAAPANVPEIAPQQLSGAVGAVETRLALLEERLSRLDLQARGAAGNAARAEGLLIAFAARRMVDRGQPLGYLEDQLRLRFADAQPNAVQTVIDVATRPVTLEQLIARLDAVEPELTNLPASNDTWGRVTRELAGLFVVRRDAEDPAARLGGLERARLLLAAGRADAAIAEVERLPGAAAARDWIMTARRYEAVQRALDLLETTAMLEPRRLQDGDGRRVDQPSPLAAPVP